MNASTSAAMSWPSTRITFQPKLSYFSPSGSTSITSFTHPSICRRLQSMTAIMLSRWKWPASMAASQTWPSCCSPSPIRQNTLCLPAIEPRRQRHAHCDAQSLAQRARRNLHARQFQPVRMPLERRAQLAQRHHILQRAKTGKRQPQIKARRLVSRRPHNAVALRPFRVAQDRAAQRADKARQ